MGFDMTMRGTPEGLPEDFPGNADGDPTWYRFNPRGMALMAALLGDLGVLVEQDEPALPTWPPHGLSQQRAQAIHAGGEASPVERDAYDAWKRASDAAAATRSPSGVPSFKFASNDGWIVEPEECLAIAAALRACRVDEAFLAHVGAMHGGLDAAVRDALVAAGHEPPPEAELSMTASELATWIADWAWWNEVAATVGGYTVT